MNRVRLGAIHLCLSTDLPFLTLFGKLGEVVRALATSGRGCGFDVASGRPSLNPPLPNVAESSIRPPPTALGEVTKLRELVDPENRIVEEQGWRVLRFSKEEVIDDVEAVAIAIAKSMGLKPTYGPHIEVRSGMRSRRSPNSKKGR